MNNRGVGIRLFVDGAQEIKRDFGQVADSGKRMWSEIGSGQKSANPALRALSTGVSEAKDGIAGLADQAGGLGSALSALGPAGVLAAAAVTGVGIAFAQARKAMDFGAEIADSAAKIGIGTTALQEYRYAISQTGGEAQDADAAIGAFTRTLGSAMSGLSPRAMKGFAALGFTQDDLLRFKSADEALQEVTRRIAEVSTEAERAAIAEKLGLTPILPLLRQGADGLDQLRQSAHDMGLVWDEDVIQNMDEAADKFDTASKVISSQFTQAFVDLVPILVKVMQTIASLARQTNAFFEGFKQVEDRNSQALVARRDQLIKMIAATADTPAGRSANAARQREIAEINQQLYQRSKAKPPMQEGATDPDLKDLKDPPKLTPGGGRSSRARAALPQRQVDILPMDLIDANTRLDRMEVVASVDLSSALRDATDQLDALRDSTRDAFRSGIETVLNGGSLWDVLKQRLREATVDGIANMLTSLWSQSTDGGMKGGGFWGTVATGMKWLFGRHAAGTGMTQAPIGLSQGEFGPELALFGRNGQVINHEDTVRLLQAAAGQAQGGSAGPNVAFTYAPVINAQGAGPREIDLLRAQITQQQRELPALVIQTVNDASQRRLIVRD